MKRLAISIAATTVIAWPLVAVAELVSRGDGLVYDTDLNITWIGDFNIFHTLAYANPNLVGDIIRAVPTVECVVGEQNYGSLLQTPCTGQYTMAAVDFTVAQPGGTSLVNWYGAQALVRYLNAMRYLGYSDWRVAGTFIWEGATRTNEVRHLWQREFGMTPGTPTANPIETAKFRGEIDYGGSRWLGTYLDSIGVNGVVSGAAIDASFPWGSSVCTARIRSWSFEMVMC